MSIAEMADRIARKAQQDAEAARKRYAVLLDDEERDEAEFGELMARLGKSPQQVEMDQIQRRSVHRDQAALKTPEELEAQRRQLIKAEEAELAAARAEFKARVDELCPADLWFLSFNGAPFGGTGREALIRLTNVPNLRANLRGQEEEKRAAIQATRAQYPDAFADET